MARSTLVFVAAPCCAAVGLFVCICAIRQLRPGLFLAGPLAAFAAGLSPQEGVERGAAGRAALKKRKLAEEAAAEAAERKWELAVRLPTSPRNRYETFDLTGDGRSHRDRLCSAAAAAAADRLAGPVH